MKKKFLIYLFVLILISPNFSYSENTPKRIVSLSPSITEIIYGLGAWKNVVGVTLYSDFPPEAKSLPKVGGFVNPNLEAILKLEPDLVIMMSDGYENQRQGDVAQVVAGLQRLEINVPIYQAVPLFASSENLEQRVFGAAIPVLPLTHEQDIRDLLTYTLLATAEESLTLQEMEQLQQIWYGEVQV